MKRRDFLWLLGAISGSTLVSSCGTRKEQARLVSSVFPPDEGAIPGVAQIRPSTCTECPAGCGVLARIRDGRPVKLEGIPGHPVNDGGLCVRGQSSLYRLYHPQRIKQPLEKTGGAHRPITWEKAFLRVAEVMRESRQAGRRDLFLSGRTTGSLSRLIGAFCGKLGVERLPEYEVYSHTAVKEANGVLFGAWDVPRCRIDESDFLLTAGADVIETHVSPAANAREISRARGRGGFSWFHVEPHFSLTGAGADKRFAVAPMKEIHLLHFLIHDLMDLGMPRNRLPREVMEAIPRLSADKVSAETGIPVADIKEIADRLIAAKRPLAIAGGVSTAHAGGLETAAAAALIQWAAGAVPDRVDFAGSESYGSVGTLRDMENLSARLEKEGAGVLFIMRANPVFSLPGRLAFRENMRKAKLSVAMGDLPDETSSEADLVLPLSHPLESWGDVEPRKGVVSILQPTIPKLHDTLSDGDALLGIMAGATGGNGPESFKELLFAAWLERLGEAGRKQLISQGHVERSLPRAAVSLNVKGAASLFKGYGLAGGAGTPFLVLAPSIRTFDGRSRPLPLLSEIPDPLTTITYGPWISVSEDDSRRAGLSDGDEAAVSTKGWKAELPVKVQPGLPGGVFVVHRDSIPSPPVGTDRRTGASIEYIAGIAVVKTGKRIALPMLSGSFSQQGRGLVPDPAHIEDPHGHKKWTLYPEHAHKDYRWGMAIDLSLCNGCSACVAACYIENNVPVAGKSDHLRGREMSWLRIEPFYDNGEVEFLPMLCQHCDNAPCEPVCPVFAAYHNPEGLNVQVYARCVGTRYCSNNCPYKVRRFNWRQHGEPESGQIHLNPDVPAREVGVMEKCTFCIQRIRTAKDKAKDESRKVSDGEFTTACAQSCPTGALVFGNLLDKGSRVYKLARSLRAHRVFETLGTEPSVHYLKGRKGGREG